MNYPAIIQTLREALNVSPGNVPLKKHLAETLYAHGFFADAEQEFKETLSLMPEDSGVKRWLAKTFVQLQKFDAASFLTEELLREPAIPDELYLLHARILAHQGKPHEALQYYNQAITRNPQLADEVFATELKTKASTDPDYWTREPLLTEYADEDISIQAEKPKQNFSDVGGMERVKEEISLKIIHPLKNPEIYRAYGKSIGGGILLYGPPGCGKTHLARATAGEVSASFISVGISDILDMYIGNSEKNLNAIFEQARRQQPCVLFFDEVDALGASRSDLRKSGGRSLINQFLSEMDGMNSHNEGILILGATNAPWHLDPAFRRAGRFDRIIFVPPPDETAREAILRILLKNKPAENVDYRALAKRTAEFSGADLKAVVDIAIEGKLAESMRKGVPLPLTNQDLKSAAEKHKPTTKDWFATAKNYALYANESGLYDEILAYLKIRK